MSKRLRRYEFSERLADILVTSRRDLRYRVTLLVTGGLIPPGPRGPGSPPATPEYAADLLIGVMAAPQQSHTIDAVRCYHNLTPAVMTHEAATPGISLGPRPSQAKHHAPSIARILAEKSCFGEALAWLLDRSRQPETRADLARELFGVWLARGFPLAAVQFATWRDERRAIVSQRYELQEGGKPPAWLDPNQGGDADPGMYHSVFLPTEKLIEIGALTSSQDERTPLMLDFGQSITDIADIAKLARDQRHRRPWKKFLSTAASARPSAETSDAKQGRLVEVAEFGSNPGNLRMLTYVPDGLPDAAPLVVVLHGCTQTALSYERGTGWTELADRYGFAVLYPEQRRRNNPLRCFNWFKSEDMTRDSGEPLSIRQMVEHMISDHHSDSKHIFITGLSAGAAMTSAMLATHPDVFAGGAIIAGVPYRCATGLQDGFEVIFQGRSRSAHEWGELVRASSPHQGPWPKISVWHGDADSTVNPVNAEEIIKQWSNVHGIAPSPTIETTVEGHGYRVWRGMGGEDLIESFTIHGMAHGAPIDAKAPEPYGSTAPFFIDAGISSTVHIAKSWGLTDRAPLPQRAAPQASTPPGDEPQSTPTNQFARGSREIAKETIIIDRLGRAKAKGKSSKQSSEESHTGARTQKNTPGGIDVQGIIAKSLELAALAKDTSGRPSGIATPGGVDLKGILSKSFELAGLAMGSQETPDPSDDETGGLAGSGWEGDGWRMLPPDIHAPQHGPALVGSVTSGSDGELGRETRSVSRTLSLGSHPRLSYVRKLDLKAAANMTTTAEFTVYVDDVAVDEVSVVGMDYSETHWTARKDIDLSAFSGRTVILKIALRANANVFKEVSAQAWVAGIAVENDPGQYDA